MLLMHVAKFIGKGYKPVCSFGWWLMVGADLF
jgi:hypothetical protein